MRKTRNATKEFSDSSHKEEYVKTKAPIILLVIIRWRLA